MNELKENIKKHIDLLCERYPALKIVESDIAMAYQVLECSYKNGGKLLVPFFFCFGCKEGVFVAGLALACESLPQVFLGLAASQFHNCCLHL